MYPQVSKVTANPPLLQVEQSGGRKDEGFLARLLGMRIAASTTREGGNAPSSSSSLPSSLPSFPPTGVAQPTPHEYKEEEEEGRGLNIQRSLSSLPDS